MTGRRGAVVATLVAVAGLGASVLAPAAPASAEVVVARDRSDDTPGRSRDGDIRKVVLAHRALGVQVDVKGPLIDYYQVWFDTDPADPGPERVATFSLETLRVQVHAVDGFSSARIPGSTDLGPVVCSSPAARARFRSGPGATAHLDVPRWCLGTPARVRVSVQAAKDFPGTTHDWAPGPQGFGPWAASG